ncbi:MAG: fibronectin type III domain-containing protein, partial [Myxococcota bacterium]
MRSVIVCLMVFGLSACGTGEVDSAAPTGSENDSGADPGDESGGPGSDGADGSDGDGDNGDGGGEGDGDSDSDSDSGDDSPPDSEPGDDAPNPDPNPDPDPSPDPDPNPDPGDGGVPDPDPSVSPELSDATTALELSYAQGESSSAITTSFELPLSGNNGVTVTWESSNPEYIAVMGSSAEVVAPPISVGDALVTLTATLTLGSESTQKEFQQTVVGESGATAALSVVEAGGDTITVSWEAPDDPNFRFVELRWEPGAGVQAADPSSTTTVIEDIAPGSRYTINAFAVYRSGESALPDTLVLTPGPRSEPVTTISTVNDLTAIESEGSYLLVNDIDLTGVEFTPLFPDTSPMTIGFGGTRFEGRLDGGGHVIRNMTISEPEAGYLGLFGSIGTDGVVVDLGVADAAVTGRFRVAGIAGTNAGTIQRSWATGVAAAENFVGGIAGVQLASGEISECHTDVELSLITRENGVSDRVGGITGGSQGRTSNSYARGNQMGDAEGEGCFISAVSGSLGERGVIEFSYGTGSVDNPGCSRGGVTSPVDADDPGTVTVSFFDTQTTGIPADQADSQGTGLTTAELQMQASFEGWDFVDETDNGTADIWAIDPAVNDGYPYL